MADEPEAGDASKCLERLYCGIDRLDYVLARTVENLPGPVVVAAEQDGRRSAERLLLDGPRQQLRVYDEPDWIDHRLDLADVVGRWADFPPMRMLL